MKHNLLTLLAALLLAPLAALHAAPSPFAEAPSATSSARSITQWAVWGPSWGRSGLSALSNGLETRIRPTPGDVLFSWGTDRRGCLAWNACEAPDGLLDFYSEGALPGVEKMAISDGAARWAGCTAYAHTYIHAETKQDVLLTVHSRRPVSMWMNGETIQRPHGQPATVHLSPGWNRLLVKVLSPSSLLDGALLKDGLPWDLRVDLSAPDGSAAKGVTMQVRDPERVADVVGPAGLPLRFLTRLSGPNGRRPLFVQDEDMALTMDVQLGTGRDTKFPKNPWDRFNGEAWTYTSSPDAGSEGIIQRPSLELTKAAPAQAAIALFDFDGKCVFRKQVDLAFKLDTNGVAVAAFPVHSGSLPVGYYSLTTDFLDTKGKVVARDHEHAVSVVWGPVDMSKDATPRKLSCVGHWLASSALPVGLEQLGWLHRVGVTKHQKISLAWSSWGVSHDGKGHVTVGDAPTVDALIGKANELGIEMVGDLTFGSVRSDPKRGGENMALTAGEQEEARRQARLEKEAIGIRLSPFGAAPLPPFGDPAFEKTLHDYAFQLVTKYKDRIKLWGGDNEIDLHSGGASPAVATVYARASRILYEAMKEADPTAQFVTASLVRRSPFTDELIRQGFARFTDHIDVHAHPFAAPAIADSVIGNTGTEGLGVLQELAKKLPLSVYYGEVSAPLAHAPNGVVGQAEGIHKQLAWALKKPAVKALSYLVLYSSGANLGFGNIYGDPLPANNAINVAAHLLDGRRILADLDGLPKGVEQIRTLGTDGRETLLLWSRTPTTITLPCPASEIELVDVIGRRSRRGVAGGVLTLRVDASPLYIVLRR